MLARRLVTVAIAAGILLFDLPDLIRHRRWGEVATHLALTLLALALALLPTFNVEVPGLFKWLVFWVRPLGEALFGPAAP